jgi:hypothetical protein
MATRDLTFWTLTDATDASEVVINPDHITEMYRWGGAGEGSMIILASGRTRKVVESLDTLKELVSES